MASKYGKAPKDVIDISKLMIKKFHAPLEDAGVRVDFIMAYGKRDENDNLTSDAIKHQGVKALGVARVLSLKDRTKGLGDAEIMLDGDWWKDAPIEQQQALIDHELQHLAVIEGEKDILGRPTLKMRKHDVQIGWFDCVAERHGVNSMERIQAKQIMDESGQCYWPVLTGSEHTSNRMARVVTEIEKK